MPAYDLSTTLRIILSCLDSVFFFFFFLPFQRYYGKSLPFGKDSFTVPKIGLLTVEQALADYAVMITELKEQLEAKNCPVIVFGGRYEPLKLSLLI